MTTMALESEVSATARSAESTALAWSVSPVLTSEHATIFAEHGTSPFDTREWTAACAEAAPDRRYAYVTAKDAQGETAALFPFSTRRALGADVLTWANQDWADYCGPTVSASLRARLDADGAETLLRDAIRASGLAPDAICFRKHPETSAGASNPFFGLAGSDHESDSGHAVSLQGPWDEFLAGTMSRRSRSTTRRKRKNLDEMGEVLFEHVTDVARRDAFAERMVAWKRDQIRGSGGMDHFADPAGLAVIKNSLDGANGALFALTLDGEPVAICHCLDGNGFGGRSRLLYQTSLSMAGPTATSPGMLLLVEVLQRSLEDGFASLDFGMGDETYKSQWTDRSFHLASVHRALTVRGLPITLKLRATIKARHAIKSRPALVGKIKAIRARALAMRPD